MNKADDYPKVEKIKSIGSILPLRIFKRNSVDMYFVTDRSDLKLQDLVRPTNKVPLIIYNIKKLKNYDLFFVGARSITGDKWDIVNNDKNIEHLSYVA